MEMMFATEPMAPQVQPKQPIGKQTSGKATGKSEKSFDDVLSADHGKNETRTAGDKGKTEKTGTEKCKTDKSKDSDDKVSSDSKSERKSDSVATESKAAKSKEDAADTTKNETAENVDPTTLANVAPVAVSTESAPQLQIQEVQKSAVEAVTAAQAASSASDTTAAGSEDTSKGGSVQENVLEQMFRFSSKADNAPLTKQMQEKLAAATQGQVDPKTEAVATRAMNQAAQAAQGAEAQADVDGQAALVNQQMTAAVNGDSMPKDHQKADAGHQVGKANLALQDGSQQQAAATLEGQGDTTGKQGEKQESHEGGQQVTTLQNDPHGLNQSNDLSGKFDAIQNGQHNQVANAGSTAGARNALEASQADSADSQVRLASGETVSEKSILDQITGRIQLQAHDGRSQIKIDLHPEELGKVKLHMVVQDNKVQVHLQTQTAQVQDVLESHLAKLRESLAQQGLKLDQVRVSVDSGQTDSRSQFQDQYASSQQQRVPRYHSNSYRVAGATDTQAINAPSGGNTSGLSGLSLRI